MDLYQPLVRSWLLGEGVIREDADDLAQDVMVVLVRKLPGFAHNGRTGSFRAWLRTVAVNQARKFWRAGRCRLAAGGAGRLTPELLDQLADSGTDLARAWDAEHDRHVYRRLLEILDAEFEPATVRVFHRLVFDQATAATVSEETGLSPAALYAARYRVMCRLRQEAAGLLD